MLIHESDSQFLPRIAGDVHGLPRDHPGHLCEDLGVREPCLRMREQLDDITRNDCVCTRQADLDDRRRRPRRNPAAVHHYITKSMSRCIEKDRFARSMAVMSVVYLRWGSVRITHCGGVGVVVEAKNVRSKGVVQGLWVCRPWPSMHRHAEEGCRCTSAIRGASMVSRYTHRHFEHQAHRLAWPPPPQVSLATPEYCVGTAEQSCESRVPPLFLRRVLMRRVPPRIMASIQAHTVAVARGRQRVDIPLHGVRCHAGMRAS